MSRLVPALSLVLLILTWAVGSWAAADPATLPGPAAVAWLIWSETTQGPLLGHLGATLARVAVSFAVALSIGAAIGVAMGRRRRLNALADPWLVVALNLPALVTISLCYIWIGLTEVAAIAAVALNKIPLVATMMREGARALDPELDEMAAAYRLGFWARLRHVVLPQLAPHFASAGRAGLALIWKIVLVVEFLGRSNGIGFQIHLYFQLFDVGRVLAYALAFVAVMLAVETFALQPWQARANRWRAR